MDNFNIKKGYTLMSNYHLRDESISHAARGLLSFMLSLPKDWNYSFNGLVSISKEGKYAIRNMINELKEAKYIKISQSRNEKGYYQYNYDVYDKPYDMPLKMVNYPTPGFRSTDYPTSDNQPQINTNKQIDKIDNIDKTKDLNHKTLINELIRLNYIPEDDDQILLYDSLFEKLVNEGNTYAEIYSSIHYIVPRVISRYFKDEDNTLITNKFGYFKVSIESNLKRFNNYNDELYLEKDFELLWNDNG